MRGVGQCNIDCENSLCLYMCKHMAIDKHYTDDYVIITVNDDKCVLCYLCEVVCPIESIKIDKGVYG